MKKLFVMLIVLAAFVPAQATNLLWNGGFETGTFEGWWTYLADPPAQSATVVPIPYEGLYSAQIYTGNGSSAQLGQDVALSPGTDVTVSLMYNIPTGSWNGAGITVQYKDASWTYLDYGYVGIFNYTTTGGGDSLWHEFTASSGEGTWTAPEGTAYLSFKIEQWGWTAGDGALYDNCSVPEPATMIMLGLGGLTLIRRKRA